MINYLKNNRLFPLGTGWYKKILLRLGFKVKSRKFKVDFEKWKKIVGSKGIN